MPVLKDKIKLNSIAVQKLFTLNPATNFWAIKIIPALITSKNNPSVKMVIGMVKKVNTGLTMAFKKANTTANIKADWYPFKLTPGKKRAMTKTAKAAKIIFKIKLMA